MKYKTLRLIAFVSFVCCVLPFLTFSCEGIKDSISVFDIASGIKFPSMTLAPRRWVYVVPACFVLVFAFSCIPVGRRFFNVLNVLASSTGLGGLVGVVYIRFNDHDIKLLETANIAISFGYAFYLVILGYLGCLILCVLWKDAKK